MNIELDGVLPLLTEKITTWYELAIKMLPNIILAILVIIFFIAISKLSRRTSKYIVSKLTHNKSVRDLLSSVISFTVLLIGIFIALELLNLEKTVTSILAGAGVIGLALGFAFQEIAANFVSGILITIRRPYKINDIIEIDNYMGTVKEINLRTTRLMNFNGLEVLIPNKAMFTKPFINYTTTPERRLDIKVGVGYDSDLKKVTQVTHEALNSLPDRISDKSTEVFFEEFGDSSINLEARVWIKYPANMNYLSARHQAIINIKDAFDQNSINIPFPIRTILKGEQND